MKYFFCYERGMTGRWGPVCYHGAEPPRLNTSKGDTPCRSEVWEVPPDCIGATDRMPMFGRLQVKFPMPGEK